MSLTVFTIRIRLLNVLETALGIYTDVKICIVHAVLYYLV